MADITKKLQRLDATLKAQGVPFVGVAILDLTTTPPKVRVDFAPNASDADKARALAIVANFDFSDAADDLFDQNSKKERARNHISASSDVGDIILAAVEFVLDELHTAVPTYNVPPEGQIRAKILQKIVVPVLISVPGPG